MKKNEIIELIALIKENEIIKDISLFYSKNKKICKTILIILMIIISYILLVFYAKKIEMTSTFPWIALNVQDLVWHVETELKIEEINLYKKNGEVLNWMYVWTWTWKTVYYFHGNWGPNHYFYSEIKYIHDLGYNVMMYDYPGYWKSEWLPYKENNDDSSQVFYDYLKKEKNIESKDLIVWWYSVWTAVATDFASKNDFERLVLVSPLSSRYDMSRKLFWFALQKILFLPDSYVTKDLVKKFNKPVLIIHWNDDFIVPFEQWKKVFEKYAWEKSFIEIDKYWHNWIIDNYWDAFKYIFKKYLNWEKLDFKDNYLFVWESEKKALEEQNYLLDKEEKEKLFLSTLDLKSDDSIQTFVTSNISFNDKTYIPKNLVNIRWNYIYDSKWWTQKLRVEAKNALDLLSKAFFENFSKKIEIVSAYRSYEYQVWIKAWGCPDNLCAKAWFSEHQTGLAFDIFEASSDIEWKNNKTLMSYHKWLDENAHLYWFHNTYKRWLSIDWYDVEPWHWRYLGVDLSTYLYENNLTFAEFYKQKNN